jgi:hypothetical protein
MPPINVHQITQGASEALLTLCILLELKQGSLLHHFHQCEIVDQRLPLGLTELQDSVENALKSAGYSGIDATQEASNLAKRFDEEQWKYLAPTFTLDQGAQYLSPCVLPFIDRRLITSKGATAKVYEIAVPEYFVDEDLRQSSPPASPHPDFPKIGPVRLVPAVRLALFRYPVSLQLHSCITETSPAHPDICVRRSIISLSKLSKMGTDICGKKRSMRTRP